MLTDLDERVGATTVGDLLLEPTVIYVQAVRELLGSDIDVRGLAHITGEGFLNLLRLEAGVGYRIDSPLPVPLVFDLVAQRGAVEDAELYEVFNMGCGFCVVVPPRHAEPAVELLRRHHPGSAVIGSATESAGTVELTGSSSSDAGRAGSRRLHSSPVSTAPASRAIRRQPPQLGTRAWPGQVVYRLDLHRGHRAEAGQRGEDVRTIARRRSGPRRQRRCPPLGVGRACAQPVPGIIVAELQSGQGRGGPRLLEVGPKGLGDRGRLEVDAKTIGVEARPATSSTSGSVRSSRRRWHMMPSRSTRRQRCSACRPCSAAALTAMQPGRWSA